MEEEKEEEVQISGSETESVKKSPVDSAELKLRAIITEGALDFDGCTALIEVVEETYHDDIEKICLVYESFLSEFPLCYGYWRKLADHKTRLCTIDKAVEVFEGAVQSATYSVDVWVDYCCFSVSAFEDPCDVRRLFRRGLSFVGKDYSCHKLWDKFIEFELSQQHWSSLAHIYIQTLRFPTKKLHRYYDSFKKLVAIWEEEMECQSDSPNKLQSELMDDIEVPTRYKDEDISSIIKDLLDPSIGLARSHALSKYLSVGEHFYQSACQLDKQICLFETHIRRSYFHTKPLDVCQLENWHQYLDFVEAQGDFDWAVKLYERCLIPCCNYPEFWMRYVDFMETKGGREIAIFALDRTTENFLKRVPVIHHFIARFKEQIGDVFSAREAVLQYKAETESGFVENVIRKANMEKRLGNYAAASNIYVEALEIAAAKEKSQTLPILYVHFSRFKLITGSAEAARDVLIDGIKQVSRCKLLVEELIRLATIHEGARDVNMINSVMASTVFSEPGVSRGLTAEEREEISNLYLEFVDLCGIIHDVRSAWNRHIKWFPHSVRTEINFPSPVAPLNAGIEERKETFVALLQPVSENCNDESMTLAEDNIPLSPENQDPQSNEAPADQISDQKFENRDIQSHQPEDADSARHDGEQRVSPEFSVSVSVSEQPKHVSEPRPSSPNLSLHEVANESDSTQASQGYSKNNLHEEEHDREPDLAAKPLSLETLSLDAKDNKSTSHEYEAPQETCMSNGSMEGGRHAHQARGSSPSSSASHQIPTTYQHDQNWHQKRYNNRYRRDSKFGFHGNSQKRQHQHQDRHRHVSSQQQYPQGGGPALPVQNSQGKQFSQVPNQYQASAGVQNVQQPSAQPQTVQYQYPVQGNDQYAQAQDSEAYNQMWQYYYYQQQQQQYFMQQQQQLLQQQQQELDPQQQQLLYQQQLQLQQQYLYQQQQQFQQLSEQQQQQQQSAYQQPQHQQLDEQQQQQQYLQQQQFLQQQQQYQLYLQQLQQSQPNQQPEAEQQEEEPEQPSQQQEQEQVHENHHNCKLVSSQPYHDSGSHLEVEETRQHITSSQSQRRVMPSDDTDTEISI